MILQSICFIHNSSELGLEISSTVVRIPRTMFWIYMGEPVDWNLLINVSYEYVDMFIFKNTLWIDEYLTY